jgi:hypothetical protein
MTMPAIILEGYHAEQCGSDRPIKLSIGWESRGYVSHHRRTDSAAPAR